VLVSALSRHRLQAEFGAALLLDLIGSAGALLIAGRFWQTIVTPRERPLTDDVLRVTGRTIDSASTAFALVALAGVVAVLATRGIGRMVIGLFVALAGIGLVWRSAASAHAVSAARARSLVEAKHSGVGVDPNVVPRVSVHTGWPVLSLACGVVVLLAGLLILVRGRRWAGMSMRYESPAARGEMAAAVVSEVDSESARTRASATLWSALDRGHDPTGDDDPGSAG
jgi:uncharacterized membrane protein (TIGR02234 family)